MSNKIDFDDLIRNGEDIKALRYLASELYDCLMIGEKRKKFLDKVADDFDKTIDIEAYANKKAIELIKENEKLKQKNNELCAEHTRLCDLIDAQNEYINHLIDELNDVVPLASSLGWESSRYKKGVLLREKIMEIGNIMEVQNEAIQFNSKSNKNSFAQ